MVGTRQNGVRELNETQGSLKATQALNPSTPQPRPCGFLYPKYTKGLEA